MKYFDLIVIGSGSGLDVAVYAAEKGMHVAIIEEGHLGGTCLNRGCIPSKMIIHSADVAEIIQRARLFGISPKGYKVDFAKITRRASKIVNKDSAEIEKGVKETENIVLFKKRGKFIGERTLVIGNKTIEGEKVVVAAGTRPAIPQIEGINDVDYITSDEALRLTKQPKRMVIMGGGFIAAELAHFYGSLGTKVTILQRSTLLNKEDREIAEAFTKSISKKYDVILGYSPKTVKQKGKKIVITAGKNKKIKKIETDSLLIATGRIPNSDILDVKKSNIETDDKGNIKVNEYLETTAKNTWALGDIVGKHLLKHSANLEAEYVMKNAIEGKKEAVDYWPMPHAIFSSPQIAAVGYTEEELKERKINYVVGKYYYKDTGMGLAIEEKEGFVKILAGKESRKILGCHIIGPDASTLIHEVVVAMQAGLTADILVDAVHVHPALSEVVQRAARRIEW